MPIFVSTYYDVPYDDVMSAYKDHERLNALMVLYHLLSRIAMPKGLTDAVIIPTPTTPERLLMRGFNPVMVLAKCLSYLWKIPIWQGLHRHDNAIHQRGLDKSARLDNVKDDFYLSEPIGCRQVILFDDVITTGATMKAMAGVIRTHHPKVKIIGVGVLHGKPKLHLPHW